MGQNDLEIYKKLRFKQFSQGCEGQAYGMLRAIEPYLLSDFAYKHSLMRIFLRPLFYMGYQDPRAPMAVVHTWSAQKPNCYKDADALYRYMEENILLAAKVIEELDLCCEYYGVEYCKKLNAVLFGEQIFHDIDELREIFLEDFRKLNLPDDEIFRIFEEESDGYYLSEFSKIQA
ncbi:MAG: hypothetical protein HFG01_05980 [Oscillibacter sp.]|jgi:hypothetical protein|nr:hypothetical protein [Oscillibacter sp.]